MPDKKLKFHCRTDVFGTHVNLSTNDKSFDQEIANGLAENPLLKMSTKISQGYWFRSPDIDIDSWNSFFSSLCQLEGKFNLWATLNDQTVTAHIKIQDKSDAALFAWSNVETWQKWSDAQETEEKELAKAAKKKPKIKVHKDGRVTVKTTVTTLGKI